jgi:lipopolysaccharide biosynthesis regulator YciM
MFFGLFFLGCYAQTDLDLAASYYERGEFEKALYLYQKLLNVPAQ